MLGSERTRYGKRCVYMWLYVAVLITIERPPSSLYGNLWAFPSCLYSDDLAESALPNVDFKMSALAMYTWCVLFRVSSFSRLLVLSG